MDPLTTDWAPEQVEVMHRLRDWAVAFAELGQHLASWMNLPNSDANALGHIVWAAEEGRPLTPADLSRQIGMTSGATTVLLNRLETAGHIRRSREHTDRRRVTLRPAEDARAQAEQYLAFAGTEIAEVLHSTDADELRRVAAFLTRIAAAGDAANKRLTGATNRRQSR